MPTDDLEPVNRLLRVIVALMLRNKDEKSLTLRQKVEVLNELGLGPTEISKILCRTGTYVSKELASIRKTKK